MKIVVAVIVYNRFNNIQTWVKCWKKSQTGDAELVIIHNYYGVVAEMEKYKSFCQANQITYVPRNRQGFDIGGLQDVFKGRLEGFPEWDYLLWCTDDTLPMTKDFITPFIEKFNFGLSSNVGVACMKLSKSVSPHIRTTGFCIKKEVAERIIFPADPVTTKTHCYHFEHRGGQMTFTNQVRAMGLDCVQVARDSVSPLWDTGYWKRLDRAVEHDLVFGTSKPTGDKVVFVCPIFDAFPEIISSLICQSNKNWELILIDDNPEVTICKAIVDAVNDKRIIYLKRNREANYGHPHRRWALNELKENRLSEGAEYVVVTNGDNWYTPNFINEMLAGFKKRHTAVATYSEKMVHSYKNWDVINCRFERGYLDCGGVMVKKDVACEIGWSDIEGHSSDWTYFQEIANRYHSSNFIPVKGCLFTHN